MFLSVALMLHLEVTLGPTLRFSRALMFPIVTLLICTIWMSEAILEYIFQGGDWSVLLQVIDESVECTHE